MTMPAPFRIEALDGFDELDHERVERAALAEANRLATGTASSASSPMSAAIKLALDGTLDFKSQGKDDQAARLAWGALVVSNGWSKFLAFLDQKGDGVSRSEISLAWLNEKNAGEALGLFLDDAAPATHARIAPGYHEWKTNSPLGKNPELATKLAAQTTEAAQGGGCLAVMILPLGAYALKLLG